MNNTLAIDPMHTYEQTLSIIHTYTAVPSVLILWIFSLFAFIGVGMFVLDKEKSNMMKFFGMWFAYAILTGVVVLWICYSPNSVQVIKDFFISFFS